MMDANDMKYFDPLLSSLGSGGGDDGISCHGDSTESFNRANEFEQKIREVCCDACY